jgi:hypothetical protein
MVEFQPYFGFFFLRRSPSIRLHTPDYAEFPDFRGRRVAPAAKMDGMADDGETKSKFTFERLIVSVRANPRLTSGDVWQPRRQG